MDGGKMCGLTDVQVIVEEEMGKGCDFNKVRWHIANRLKCLGFFSLGVDRVDQNGRYMVEVLYYDLYGRKQVVQFPEQCDMSKRYGDADHWGR